MVKTGLGSEELGKVRFWQLAVSELIGTFLVVLVCSLVVSRHDGKAVLLSVSLVTGLLYSVVLFIFGNHGYFNPALTLSLFLSKRIPLVRMGVYMFAQLMGAILAQVIAGYIMIQAWYSPYGPGAPLPNGNVNLFLVFLLETFGTIALSAVISNHCSPTLIGLTLSLTTAVIFPYTMACMNPARSFSSHLVAASFPSYCWIYWFGPLIGAGIGRAAMMAATKINIQVQPSELEKAKQRLLSDSD